MRVQVSNGGVQYEADLLKPLDISLSLGPHGDNPNAFGIPPAEISPIVLGSFVGSVAQGSGANCDFIKFCAHGNTTHTECFGHISANHENVGDEISDYFFAAELITVPVVVEIKRADLEAKIQHITPGIIIRTWPNTEDKKNRNWSGNHPPYFSLDAMKLLNERGYLHLFTDLPSVDPEQDDGALVAHHIWWNYPENTRRKASITELIFVDNNIEDGLYLVNLQFADFKSDASPSRPLLFKLEKAI